MASKTIVMLEDDLDGGPATETVSFGIDGVVYEIDLNDQNAKKLRDAFAPYIAEGRRVNGRARRGRGNSVGKNAHATQIRQWAVDNGIKISDRGRIPLAIQRQYEEAQG